MAFRETKLVLFAADLAGFGRATAGMDALGIAAFLSDWCTTCGEVVARHGGRVVKFMGDACLATFPEAASVAAVDAAAALAGAVEPMRARHRVSVDVGVNVHLAVVAEGELGAGENARYDVVGSGVNHLFQMGGGSGTRISEPVYRQLPTERRAPWKKQRPPATYSFTR